MQIVDPPPNQSKCPSSIGYNIFVICRTVQKTLLLSNCKQGSGQSVESTKKKSENFISLRKKKSTVKLAISPKFIECFKHNY